MTTEVREYINTHVYAIQCFLMLRFCHVIKYRSMWHVDAVGHHGAKSMSYSLDHVLFLQVESSPSQAALR